MADRQGGTQKWCPNCAAVTVVKAIVIEAAHTLTIDEPLMQRVIYRIGKEEVHYFRRGQQCQDCFHEWLSAEVPEGLIRELVDLKDRIDTQNAEASSKQSENRNLRLV
ncbi:hypothetical protein ACQ86B_17495 [Mycolicibacterium aichiense]|uniref:hypothetical protein n=1 Tax=Mycolicibacterium aichiense TaxID=1799 RepID=UPI003D66784E